MILKKNTYRTPGTRHQIKIKKNVLSKYNTIVKKFYKHIKSKGGRNNYGRITIRHKGEIKKKKIHTTNVNSFYKTILICVLYNSKKNSFTNLCFDIFSKKFIKNGANTNIYVGAISQYKNNSLEPKLGYRGCLNNFTLGSVISLISHKKNTHKYKLASSAGCFCQIIQKKGPITLIKLPSGLYYSLNNSNYIATFGTISNTEHKNIIIGKAGRNRLLGIRPSVRGIAMNPVDHPHGGRSNKGMMPVTP